MTIMRKILASGAGLAALAAAAPAAAQYPYAYARPYANPYAYNMAATQIAAQQCTAAVQSRLQTRTGLTGIIGSLLGAYTTTPRVLSITQVVPRRSTVTVRGLASSGRMAHNPWGMGAYGAAGYAYQPDLQFTCRVDYRGFVRDVDIDRRY